MDNCPHLSVIGGERSIAMKRKDKFPRIHIHIYRGRVDRISSRGLSEPVELKVFDHDVQTTDGLQGYEIYVYHLGAKSKKKAR